jgi:hypothetical protein
MRHIIENTIIANWFTNIKNGKANEPILLLIGLTYETEIQVKGYLTHISHNQTSEKFYTIGQLKANSFRFLENDFERSHILYTNSSIDYSILASTDREIICIVLDTAKNTYLKIDSRFDDLIPNCDRYKSDVILHPKEEYQLIINKRDPIEVLKQSIEAIESLLNFFIYNRYVKFYKFSRVLFRGYTFDIKKDLMFLEETNILTSRLAIVIYKICTFTDEKDKNIGNFYARRLGVISKKKSNKLYDIDSKCYELNKSSIFKDFIIEGVIYE